MPFTVQDLLDLPVLAGARPEVLVGQDLDRRPVRWIHSSEIYEIWSLLKGGEALLTTGLGLVGNSPTALDVYCRNLADRNVAVLMLELGRTFPVPPQHLVDAAAANGLPLVALHGVVPFIDITETVHPLLLESETARLRASERTSSALTRSLLAGTGLNHLVATVAAICEAPVGVYLPDGSLLAGADVSLPAETGDSPFDGLAVGIGPGPWATLRLAAKETPELRHLAMLCADAVGIQLAHEHRLAPSRPSAAASLLRDLATRRPLRPAELTARAGALGLRRRVGAASVGIAVTTMTPGPSALVAAVSATAQATFGPVATAQVDQDVLVATLLPRAEARQLLETFLAALDVALGGAGAVGAGGNVGAVGNSLRVVAGPLGDSVLDLVRSVPAALDAAALASRLGLGSRLVLASDLAVYDALASMGDSNLERFVTDQLGPLLDRDARTGSELVSTLDAYLESGLSKTAAAAALGVRRQTLYARLEKMNGLLGGLDLHDRQRRTALDLALAAWRMRSSPAAPSPR